MTELEEQPPVPHQVCRVLLVEDEPAVREGIAVLLEIEPDLALVGSAASAEEALLLVPELEPDLVLLDNRLEGVLTGVEAAPAFKQLAPAATVLLCTAATEQEVEGHPGVDGYLCKDDLVSLPDAVRQARGKA
ncbi:MAG TPA: response regulator transcription factor [Mycobacteriales bacterium]|nr:response regulator transcription factor [Mycobacteriales bacterium]